MTFCTIDRYSLNGSIINTNEFRIESYFQKSDVNTSSHVPFFIPNFCTIQNSHYKITEIWSHAFYLTEFTDISIPSTIKSIKMQLSRECIILIRLISQFLKSLQ